MKIERGRVAVAQKRYSYTQGDFVSERQGQLYR